MARSLQPEAQRSLRASRRRRQRRYVVDHEPDLGGDAQQVADGREEFVAGGDVGRGRRGRSGGVSATSGCRRGDASGLVRKDEVEPAKPGDAQLARELRQAGQHRPDEHRVRDGLQPDGEEIGDRGHDVVVAAGAAQLVVDLARAVDADQRLQQAASDARELVRGGRVDETVEEEAGLGFVPAGDVVHKGREVVAQKRVAADEDEARGTERRALVDRVLPLVRGQLVRVPWRIAVVAVPARSPAAVGQVQVDLAQAFERLTSSGRGAVQPFEKGEILRPVDVDP